MGSMRRCIDQSISDLSDTRNQMNRNKNPPDECEFDFDFRYFYHEVEIKIMLSYLALLWDKRFKY